MVPIIISVIYVICIPLSESSQGIADERAPEFGAVDLQGKRYEISSMTSMPMLVLYFFDVVSDSNREGLEILNRLASRYEDSEFAVWAITRSSKPEILNLFSDETMEVPILLDRSGISDLYQVGRLLPIAYIIGPDRRILDKIQGGGEALEMMLFKIAEANLNRPPELARDISSQIAEVEPNNLEIQATHAYSEIKAGNLEIAEKIAKNIPKNTDKGEILSEEVFATLNALKGDVKKAMEAIEKLNRKAPGRVQAPKIHAQLLHEQNKPKEALLESRKAIVMTEGMDFQKAAAHNQHGRLLSLHGEHRSAIPSYRKALDWDPLYPAPISNIGVAYGKEGQWTNALGAYRRVLALHGSDIFATTLARRAQEMVELERDRDKRDRIQKLIEKLAERYRSMKLTREKDADLWTSRPLVLAFLDLEEKGGLTERDGIAQVLEIKLTEQFNSSGRINVVERAVLDHLLEELNLGSSELADPSTALRLGKVLAAKLIATGAIHYSAKDILLNMRLIDTETTKVPKTVVKKLSMYDFERAVQRLHRDLFEAIVRAYPLKGFIVQAEGDEAIINLGRNQGCQSGTKFEVLGAAKQIKYKGKILRGAARVIGRMEVTSVEPDFSHARIINYERQLKTDDKVREISAEVSL